MIHFNSIAFCYNNLVGICGRWEGKGNVYFKELWLIEQVHVCPLSDTFSVGKTLVPWVKKGIADFYDSARVEDIIVYSTQDSWEKVWFSTSVPQFELWVQKFSHYHSLTACSG